MPKVLLDANRSPPGSCFSHLLFPLPRRIFKDPFRGGDNIIVMCDCYDPKTNLPLPGNTRAPAAEIFKKVDAQLVGAGLALRS